MQRGRKYPQIIERWMSPDEYWGWHPPLRCNFIITVNVPGLGPLPMDSTHTDVHVDVTTGIAAYDWVVSSYPGYVFGFQFQQELLLPDPGVVWVWQVLDALGEGWISRRVSNQHNNPFNTGYLGPGDWGEPFVKLGSPGWEPDATSTAIWPTFYHGN